ncbi:gliding motility-associated C-terminal domain-containing protein [Spirosoma agri]|uniref:T9SS type B sorting domain-containing protein n=1 Tax=Spirosoma agri TaxID=1987381 RepID=A0A6M0IRJ2_9BACT|nr:gliding motility-associated C-terminal domain-containing protein [Spirosoma agri]NEU70928.1 T9SS type B sorting domain-containing protein [Spirosoma agri]
MNYVYLFIVWLLTGSIAYAQDCPSLGVPSIKLTKVGFSTEKATASFCQGERVQLNALTNAKTVTYQWQRNGKNIDGATGSTLLVDQSGAYTVMLYRTDSCPDSTTSAATIISANQCGSTGLLPIIGGQLEDYNGNAESLSSMLLRAAYLTNSTSLSKFPPSIKAYVYRKRDSSSVATVVMVRGAVLDGQYTPLPAACNGDSSRINSVVYFGSINFLPSVNDPAGYFMTTEPVCCREVSDNVKGTGPVVFYMEFGDRTKYKISAPKSTFGGIFNLPTRVETCVNQPVRLYNYAYPGVNFNKTVYSLVSPSTGDASTPIKDVTWASTYNANSFMETTNPLQISGTGIITGTPSTVGTYRYVVKAELYQDTFKGFEIRRELSLQVKECPAVTTPSIFISAVGKPSERLKSTLCENGVVQLNAKSPLKDVDFQWYRDSVAINGATDSILITRQAGRYTVLVTKELACPRTAFSSPVSLTISPNPTVKLAVSSSAGSLCQGNSFTLSAASSATGATYSWQRDTATIAVATSSFYRTNLAGSYVVTVTDANGCSGRSTALPVVPNLLPEATLASAASTTSFCPGSTLRLQANAGSGLTYQWLKNDSPIAGATSAMYEAGTVGQYKIVVQDANSCTAVSSAKTVSAASVPTVRINGPAQLCRSMSVNLNATGNEPLLQYTWLLNGTSIPGALTTTYEAKSGGLYQVRVTNTNQCTAISSSWTLTEIDKADIRFDSIPALCGTDGMPVRLTGTPAGGVFSGNGVSGEQFSPALSGLGSHEIVYTFTGTSTCQGGSAKRTVLVRPLPDVNVPSELAIQPGESINLPGPVNGNYQYNWTPTLTLDNPTIARPMARPDSTTTYRLAIQDQFGCESSASLVVYVESRLYIPDAFTPNGDGQNDVWELRNVSKLNNVDVTVFNRWGTIVFHSSGYTTPFNGQDLPDGPYAYVISYGTPKKRQTGQVMLIR